MTRHAALALLVVFTPLAAYGCSHEPKESSWSSKHTEPERPPVEVELGSAERRAMPKVVTLLGNVMADQQSEVAANVSGRVIMANVERGQRVKLGETLVIVESRVAKLSASAATSQAELAATQAAQGRADCARAGGLLAAGAIGKVEFDRQRSQCTAQRLQAKAARAQARMSAKLAADARVRSPFTGVIGERYVSPGEYVNPNTKVATIYGLDPVRIMISVPEQGVSLVRKGGVLNIQVSAYPGRLFPATVQHVSPALRTLQRDLLFEATAANPEGLLRPGMFATVQASLGDEQVVTVPSDAILADGDVRRLFIVRDSRAFELVVRTGVTHDNRTVVFEDLASDTPVIRRPPEAVHDGAPVAAAARAGTNATHASN